MRVELLLPVILVLSVVMIKHLFILILKRVVMANPSHLVLIWVLDIVVRFLTVIVVIIIIFAVMFVSSVHCVGHSMIFIPGFFLLILATTISMMLRIRFPFILLCILMFHATEFFVRHHMMLLFFGLVLIRNIILLVFTGLTRGWLILSIFVSLSLRVTPWFTWTIIHSIDVGMLMRVAWMMDAV